MALDVHPSRRFAPEMQAACKALAHPIRLAVVELVEERPRRFADLIEGTGKTAGTLSPHLRQLQKGGLLGKELREATNGIREEYTLTRFGERVLLAWDQAFGIPVTSSLRISVGSAGSENMERESMTERSSIRNTSRISLEMG